MQNWDEETNERPAATLGISNTESENIGRVVAHPSAKEFGRLFKIGTRQFKQLQERDPFIGKFLGQPHHDSAPTAINIQLDTLLIQNGSH